MFETIIRASRSFARGASLCTKSLYRTAKAHYHVLGKYTAPLENELLDSDSDSIPTLAEITYLEHILFTITLIIPLSWLLSLVIIPILYNSILWLSKTFKVLVDLAFFDLPEAQMDRDHELAPDNKKLNYQNWYRFLYGMPGVIFGVILSFVFVPVIFITRVISNIAKSFILAFFATLNLVLKKYSIPEPSFDKPKSLFKYLGSVGMIAGVILGFAAIGLTGIGYSAFYSWKMFKNNMVRAFNLIRKSEQKILLANQSESDAPVNFKLWQYILGSPGIILGIILGVFPFLAAFIERMYLESIIAVKAVFESAKNLVIVKQEQDNIDFFLFGFPGIILGLIGGFGYGIIKHTLLTFVQTAASSINLVYADTIKNNLIKDSRPKRLKIGYGVFGLLIGFASGIVIVPLTFIFRTVTEGILLSFYTVKKMFFIQQNFPEEGTKLLKGPGIWGLIPGAIIGAAGTIFLNSTVTFLNVTASMINAVVDEEYKIKQFNFAKDNASRSALEIYGLGLIGFLLGGIVGFCAMTITSIIINSYKSYKQTFNSCINIALKHEFKNDLFHDDKRGFFSRYILALPGELLAIVPGIIGFGFIFTTRILNEGSFTIAQVFLRIANLALPKNFENHSLEKKRDTSDLVFGAWGWIPGIIAGLIATIPILILRCLKDSLLSFIHCSASLINLVLHEENKIIKFGINIDQSARLYHEIWLLGFPGIFFSMVLGTISMGFVALGRILSNSFKAMLIMSIHGFNLVKKDDLLEIPFSPSKNKKQLSLSAMDESDILAIGFPGTLIGSILGVFTFTASCLYRALLESFETAKPLFFLIINLILPKNSEIKIDAIKRSDSDIYFWGLSGGIVGPLMGFLAALTIGITRIISNSLVSLAATFVAFSNKSLHKDDHFTRFPRRETVDKILGFPGVIIGAILGSLSFLLIGMVRFVTNSVKVSIYISSLAINSVGFKKSINTAKPGIDFSPYLGAPGYLVGPIPAAVCFTVACLVRAAQESYQTAKSAFIQSINVILKEKIPEDKNKSRSNLDYFFGLFGLLSYIAGGLAIPVIAVWYTLTNFSESFEYAFVKVVTLSEFLNISSKQDTRRTPGEIYGFGIFGIIAGGFFGVIVYVGLGFVEIISHSYNSGKRIFSNIANLGSDKEKRFNLEGLEENDERHWALKYPCAIPGLFLGILLGSVTLTGIYISKFIEHNFISCYTLIGAILNVSFGRVFFNALANDNRSNYQKASGFMGYGLACLTLPIAAVVLLARVLLPTIIALIIGTAASILVVVKKWYGMYSEPRFKPNDNFDQLQALKDLNSSLTVFGEFPEGDIIPKNTKGNKGAGIFVVKAITFDQVSITEFILDEYLKTFREGALSPRLDEIEIKVHQYFNEYHCCIQPEEMEKQKRQIKEIVTFIDNYFKNDQQTVPKDLYAPTKYNFMGTFFGKKTNDSQSITTSNVKVAI